MRARGPRLKIHPPPAGKILTPGPFGSLGDTPGPGFLGGPRGFETKRVYKFPWGGLSFSIENLFLKKGITLAGSPTEFGKGPPKPQ